MKRAAKMMLLASVPASLALELSTTNNSYLAAPRLSSSSSNLSFSHKIEIRAPRVFCCCTGARHDGRACRGQGVCRRLDQLADPHRLLLLLLRGQHKCRHDARHCQEVRRGASRARRRRLHLCRRLPRLRSDRGRAGRRGAHFQTAHIWKGFRLSNRKTRSSESRSRMNLSNPCQRPGGNATQCRAGARLSSAENF
eukprot:2980657-Pleurochrysis_carterae.AAC.5